MTLEQLKSKYLIFPISLERLQAYINWYNECSYVSNWDTERYEFCIDALEYSKQEGIKQIL